jgi:type II restriction/modification system DNA methylase subunit YeeA
MITMQTALAYRTNRDLFSNHYLDEHLPETEAWEAVSDAELEAVREEILDLWNREKDTAPERTEASLEETFIRPIFRKLGIPFEVEETVSRGQRRPDYGFFETEEAARNAFDRREETGDFYENAVGVADAKRWGRPLDTRGSGEHKRDFENPSYQIHVYLQETPTRWAVLTDGKKWRLYYGPTSHRLDSYYEVDLPTILEGGDLEDFKYFYLFFRHEAFVKDATGDCFLDDVYEESNVFAEELGEDLQENIYEAIRVLSEGFLQYSGNDLDESDLGLVHDSSLIYLYRIIFVLYTEAEGRDLLDTDNRIYEENYSINTLKQAVAEELDSDSPKYKDWQTNIGDRLDELFQLIDQGSKQQGIPEKDLYIPAYNGGLFRTDPDEDDSDEARFLANHEVGDAHLARVIELLTRSANAGNGTTGEGKIFVDYSSLDVRHLGSIYEGLLEYQLNVAEKDLAVDDEEYVPAEEGDEVVIEEGDIYLTTDSGERKATGSYYTPEYVVEYIVENTLGPLVDDIRKDLAGQTAHGEGGFAGEFADRIFELKVLDPAMGSGHFLTSAVDYLAREIIDAQEKQAAQEGIETVDEERDINWARRQVAQRCIYGVDLNPLAVELSKVSLWLRTLAAEQPLAFLDHHLKTGNSLVGSDIETVLDNGDPDNGTEEGQLTLQESFDRTRQQALEHVTDQFEDLLAIDNETLSDIKKMEAVYEEVRDDPLYQHLIAMANVHTAERFGLDVPGDAYKRMAEALRDDSWESIEGQDWYRSAQEMADDERFFHWELEFPIAFYEQDGERKEDGGFDAVIGNPPYVKIQELRETVPKQADYYTWKYESATGNFDIYVPFTEKGYSLVSEKGVMGYIQPHKFFQAEFGKELRRKISDEEAIKELISFGEYQVFEDVSIYTCILILSKKQHEEFDYIETKPEELQGASKIKTYSLESNYGSEKWVFQSPEITEILDKIKKQGEALENLTESVFQGIATSADKVYILDEIDIKEDLVHVRDHINGEEHYLEKEILKPVLKGDDSGRYTSLDSTLRLIFPYEIEEEKDGYTATFISEEELSKKYPRTYTYLKKHESKLRKRETGRMDHDEWHDYVYPKNLTKYEQSYVVTPRLGNQPEFTWKGGGLYHNTDIEGVFLNESVDLDPLYILSVLNSSVFWFFMINTGSTFRGGYYTFRSEYLYPYAIPEINTNSNSFSHRESLMDEFNTYLSGGSSKPNPKTESAIHDFLAEAAKMLISFNKERHALNLNLLDYLGIPSDGLPDSMAGETLDGLQMPVAGVADTPLTRTAADLDGLRVEDVSFAEDGGRLVMAVDISYKPDEDDPRETDRWDRLTESEFETYEAMAFVGLSDEQETLIRNFVPVAVDEGGGFADFRQSATKTNSPLDRLKALTLPDIEQVRDGLEQYIEVKARADELDEKIEKTDQLIDEIVYDLYGLTDEEIEIVEEAVGD